MVGYIAFRQDLSSREVHYSVGKKGFASDSRFDAKIWKTKQAAERSLGLEYSGVTGSRAVSKYKRGWIVQRIDTDEFYPIYPERARR